MRIASEILLRDVAQFLKVLADETRIQILWLLFNHPELCVCDIMKALGITQSKASRRRAGSQNLHNWMERKDREAT